MATQFIPPGGLPANTPVGTDGTTLETISEKADASVQADGGDATNLTVTATGATTSRTEGDRAADRLYVNDFGLTGTTAGDTAAFIAANNAVAGDSEAAIIGIAPGTTVNGDGSTDLFSANRVIVSGHGELKGFLKKQAHREYLASPIMFAPTVRPEHLINFHNALATGSANVVVVGDSIPSVGANLISTAESPTFALIDEIQKQNPNRTINFTNCAVPGSDFGDQWSDTFMPPAWLNNPNKLSCKEYVCSLNPDLLIIYSGGNDGWSINGNAKYMQELVTYYQTASNFPSGKIPSIVFCVTFQPSVASSTNDYNTQKTQDGITAALTYVRNFAISRGFGYLDFGRWHSIVRDGIDPCELALTRVTPAAGTTLPAFSQLLPAPTNNTWFFPACTNDTGVSADNVTDYLVSFKLETDPGNFEINLATTDYFSNNNLFVLNKNGYIYVSYQDGVNSDQLATLTDIPWPTGSSVWTIIVKGSRVRVEYQQPLDNGWDYSGQGPVVGGMGMTAVFDHDVIRFGAPMAPRINLGAAVQLTIYNLCVGNSTVAQTSGNRTTGQRYRPIVSDYEIYVEDDAHFGGSSAYHLNAYGVRICMAPVIRAQQWGAPSFGVLTCSSIDCHGNGIVGGNLTVGGTQWVNGVYIGADSYGNAGPYIVKSSDGGLQILVNAGTDTPSGSVEICALNKDGSNATQYSIGKFNIKTGSFVAAGPVGANGVTPASKPEITGTKSTDAVVSQLVTALSDLGMVTDSTT